LLARRGKGARRFLRRKQRSVGKPEKKFAREENLDAEACLGKRKRKQHPKGDACVVF